MAITYGSYLKLDELLSLQTPLSEGEHDETLFIVVHQVYELWFKQILHESALLQKSFETNQVPQSLATLRRILCILKTIVAQIDVLETLSPLSFLSFRSRLETASGFQSFQFRDLEFVMGKRSSQALDHMPDNSPYRKRLEKRLSQPSVYDSFLRLLKLNNYSIPQKTLDRDFSKPNEESTEIQKILLEIYRSDSVLAPVCERLVDLDEGIQEWRYRHVKMVERTMGTRKGTGGSMGAQYLRSTLFQPLFPDLWIVRSDF
jgi:tryptophan 2,3-dioxygenase